MYKNSRKYARIKKICDFCVLSQKPLKKMCCVSAIELPMNMNKQIENSA
jgi:hypothetical protein